MIQAYFLKHWNVFSLGFGFGKAAPGIFDLSIGVGPFTIGVQYSKQKQVSELLKEMDEHEHLRQVGEETSNQA